MKKFVLGLVTGVLLTISTSVLASDTFEEVKAHIRDLRIYLDGRDVTPNHPILIHEGNSYLPIREMMQLFGKKVTWNEKKQQVELFSLTDKDSYAFAPDWRYVIMGEQMRTRYRDVSLSIMQKTDLAEQVALPEFASAGEPETISLPWGKANLVRLEWSQTEWLDEAGYEGGYSTEDEIPTWSGLYGKGTVAYWIYVTRPAKEQGKVYTYILEGVVTGDEAAAKEQLRHTAETWKLPKL